MLPPVETTPAAQTVDEYRRRPTLPDREIGRRGPVGADERAAR